MKYKVGYIVRIKKECLSSWAGEMMTIDEVIDDSYKMVEDGGFALWHEYLFERLVYPTESIVLKRGEGMHKDDNPHVSAYYKIGDEVIEQYHLFNNGNEFDFVEYAKDAFGIMESRIKYFKEENGKKEEKIIEFDFEKFTKGKHVIHCKTKLEAITLLSWLAGKGHTWCTGESLLSLTCWDFHKENTCYTFWDGNNDEGLVYCKKDFYKEEGCIIFPFSTDLLK